MLVGLLTGHISLHFMLHKMKKAKNPSCRRCDAEKEMSEHTLCECLGLGNMRMQTLGFTSQDGPESNKRGEIEQYL